MKISKYILAFVAIAIAHQALAADTLKVSLSEAIAMALQNRFDLAANKYNIDIAQTDVEGKRDERLPDISGAGNVRLNTQIQQAYIPAGFAGLQHPMLVSFGASNIAVFGLDLNQAVFQPTLRKDIELSRTQVDYQQERWRADEHIIRERVAQAYLNVLLSELQWRIVQSNEQRFADYLRVAEGRFNNGALLETDLLKARLDLGNASIETEKAQQRMKQAQMQLLYQMNVPQDRGIQLTESLNTLAIMNSALSIDQAWANRSDLRLLMLQKNQQLLTYERIKRGTLPSISFFANYSQQFTYMNFDIAQKQWWSPFSFVGVRLNVPISAYYKNDHNKKSSVLRLKQTELMIEQRKEDIRYQTNSAQIDVENALRNKQQAEENFKLSERVLKTQKAQYEAGSLLYLQLLDTERSLSLAEQNYVRAVYDLMVAQLNYEKAIGNY